MTRDGTRCGSRSRRLGLPRPSAYSGLCACIYERSRAGRVRRVTADSTRSLLAADRRSCPVSSDRWFQPAAHRPRLTRGRTPSRLGTSCKRSQVAARTRPKSRPASGFMRLHRMSFASARRSERRRAAWVAPHAQTGLPDARATTNVTVGGLDNLTTNGRSIIIGRRFARSPIGGRKQSPERIRLTSDQSAGGKVAWVAANAEVRRNLWLIPSLGTSSMLRTSWLSPWHFSKRKCCG
jgi:hypothetical protein